MVGWPILSGYS